ncbi:MAG: ISL3 family transposase [Eubacteriales bacterium]|nr:ISL3 family transposase [Eubacteriales bacterium]
MSSSAKAILGIEDCEIETVESQTKKGRTYTGMNIRYAGKVPEVCPECGEKLYKHGTRPIELTDTPMGGQPCRWMVNLPRRRCVKCGYMWKASLTGIDEDRKITDRAMLDITEKALRNTFSAVADEYLLSVNTVKNVFVDFINNNRKDLRFVTPAFIGIDEIKIKKLGEVTVITDLEHRTLFDMLLGRNQKTLTEYFMNLADRDKVFWVCSDMYRPFEKSIADAMPNARWAIDHFHVVMKANEAVDAVRRVLQSTMKKTDRIKTKRGLAYTLKTRAKHLTLEEANKIRLCRSDKELQPLAIAFDLKEDFFNIYDENKTSKEAAQEAFRKWEESIPPDALYDKFRDLAKTVHNFYEQIFNYWDCPIQISNGYTECTNRLIRENSTRGRGYSFDILRGRTLYRKTNVKNLLMSGMVTIGPAIPETGPVFHYEGGDSDDYDDEEELVAGVDFDPDTGEIFE